MPIAQSIDRLEDTSWTMNASNVSESLLRQIIREEILREFASRETNHTLLGTVGRVERPNCSNAANPHHLSSIDKLIFQSMNLSKGMIYHLTTMTPIDDNVYRPGTSEFFALFKEARTLYRQGMYDATQAEMVWLDSDIGEWEVFDGKRVPLDFPMWDEDFPVSEAKYKGRDVTLGLKGAKRSGGRAHVYVRDPKTGKVKKISFGSSMPDAMGDSEAHKKRRKNFGDRHDCANKKDKTKPGYWACRATKMFGRNIPGWW